MRPEVVAVTIPIVISVGAFAMICWLAWVSAQRRQTESRLQAELHQRVLEKFGSAAEFTTFLQTEEGKRFLKGSVDRYKPFRRILNAIQAGAILALFGLSFVIMRAFEVVPDKEIVIPGIIFLALGAGFLISAGISYLLAKKWGLLQHPEK